MDTYTGATYTKIPKTLVQTNINNGGLKTSP